MRADSRETSSTNNDTGATTSTDTGAMEAKANCDEVLETTTPAVNPKKVKAAVAAIREILGATSTADTDESAAATTGAQGLQRTWVEECKNVSKCRVFV